MKAVRYLPFTCDRFWSYAKYLQEMIEVPGYGKVQAQFHVDMDYRCAN